MPYAHSHCHLSLPLIVICSLSALIQSVMFAIATFDDVPTTGYDQLSNLRRQADKVPASPTATHLPVLYTPVRPSQQLASEDQLYRRKDSNWCVSPSPLFTTAPRFQKGLLSLAGSTGLMFKRRGSQSATRTTLAARRSRAACFAMYSSCCCIRSLLVKRADRYTAACACLLLV